MQFWIGSRRFFLFLLGLFFLSLGVVLMIEADLGVSPWDVFHIGLENNIPLTLGQTVQVVGFCLVMTSWILGFRPDLGTILNMIFVGLFIDFLFFIELIPSPAGIYLQSLFFLLGLIVFALGTGTYINADWGGGPRDSLMLALNKRFGFGIIKVRTTMEVSALIVGFLLGGPLGIGTVIFSLTIGVLVQSFLKQTKRFFAEG